MSADQDELKLVEVAYVGAGNPAPQNKALFDGGKYPFFRTSDVGKIRFGEILTSVDLLNDLGAASLRIVPRGTILMPKSGASTFLNHRVITGVDGYVSSHLATVTAKDGIADARYLLYALSRVRAQDLLPENSYPSLNLSLIKGITIPLPPLEEQRRIVAVLDEAFEGLDRARAHVEANLQDARELFESTLNRVFAERGWCTTPLDALAHKDCSLSYGIVQPGEEVPDGLPLVRPTNLTRRTVDLGGLKRIDPERAASYGRTTLVGGELLLCVRGSTGTVSLAAEELCGGNVTRGIVPVRFDSSKIDIRFAYYQFRSKYVQNQIVEKTYGAALMQINIRDLRKLNIFRPSLEEQYSEGENLEAIEREHNHLCKAYQKRLVDLNELRQSILQRAFAGELT